MKHLSSILFLLLFVFAGNIQAEEIQGQHGNNLSLFPTTCFACQNIGILEGIQDGQETNEMYGFDICFIHQPPETDLLKTSINIVAEVNSVIVPVHINLFLIDLPPPSFS